MAEEVQSRVEELLAQARSFYQRHIIGYPPIECLEDIVHLYKSHGLPSDEKLKEAHKWLGLISSFGGDHYKAIENIEKATELGMEPSPVMVRELGLSLFLEEHYEKAIQPLRQAIAFDEEDVQVRLALGLSLLKFSEELFMNCGRSAGVYGYGLKALGHCEVLKEQDPSLANLLRGSIENAAWRSYR